MSDESAEPKQPSEPVDPVDAIEHAIAAAKAWSEQDPDAVTRAELDDLIIAAEAGDPGVRDELVTRFGGRLDFGTAGLRGELGAGPTRMNRVLVAQAAAGLAAFLLGREPHPSVVIGYDGRHNSEVFARDTAELMQGAGVTATLLPRMLPTPVLAFAVRHLPASAGVMVTASHNPAADNGYKVYLGGLDNGSQIVAPADGEIQAKILEVSASPITGLPRSTDYSVADESVVDEYVSRTAALVGDAPAPIRFVYTAMHGVGWETARRVFAAAGLPEAITVDEQLEPDPTFPTVSFPNPEEPGAMDLAFATATRSDAQLVIANDPDADRVAIGVPDTSAPGGWRRLSGNEVGWLLGWRAARRLERLDRDGTLACSVVSSPALGAVARKYRLDFTETLTGFKWISRAGGLAYGYEEALGYLVDPDKVRDKDGISAAVEALALASELIAEGKTLDHHLAEFAEKFGAYASSQISIRVSELSEIPRTMARLRLTPPAEIGGVRVAQLDDFREGFGSFPPSDLLRFELEGGGRVIVRPSGTEPKLKCYLDTWSTDGTAAERTATAEAMLARLDAGMRELLS